MRLHLALLLLRFLAFALFLYDRFRWFFHIPRIAQCCDRDAWIGVSGSASFYALFVVFTVSAFSLQHGGPVKQFCCLDCCVCQIVRPTRPLPHLLLFLAGLLFPSVYALRGFLMAVVRLFAVLLV